MEGVSPFGHAVGRDRRGQLRLRAVFRYVSREHLSGGNPADVHDSAIPGHCFPRVGDVGLFPESAICDDVQVRVPLLQTLGPCDLKRGYVPDHVGPPPFRSTQILKALLEPFELFPQGSIRRCKREREQPGIVHVGDEPPDPGSELMGANLGTTRTDPGLASAECDMQGSRSALAEDGMPTARCELAS